MEMQWYWLKEQSYHIKSLTFYSSGGMGGDPCDFNYRIQRNFFILDVIAVPNNIEINNIQWVTSGTMYTLNKTFVIDITSLEIKVNIDI